MSNRMQGLFVKRLVFSFDFYGHKHEVLIAANVGIWERSFVCFVDAGLEALGCQDETYLIVKLPIRGNFWGGECWQG